MVGNRKNKNSLEKVNKLLKHIKNINKIMEELDVPEQVLEKEIKPFGNASHIILPKGYANKKAKVIIKK